MLEETIRDLDGGQKPARPTRLSDPSPPPPATAPGPRSGESDEPLPGGHTTRSPAESRRSNKRTGKPTLGGDFPGLLCFVCPSVRFVIFWGGSGERRHFLCTSLKDKQALSGLKLIQEPSIPNLQQN